MSNISDILNQRIEKVRPRQSILGVVTAMKAGGIGDISLTDGISIRNVRIPFDALEGEMVTCVRPVGSAQWIVLGKAENARTMGGTSVGSTGSTPDEDIFISRPPYNVRPIASFEFIGIMWDAWPDFIGVYEVQMAIEETFTDSTTVIITSGNMYITTDVTPHYFRVRSVSKKSALSAWSDTIYVEQGLSTMAYLDLIDTGNTYTGHARKMPVVTELEDGLEFEMPVRNFQDLWNTPDSLIGQGGKLVRVRVDETGIDFVVGGGGELAPIQTEKHRWHVDGPLFAVDEVDGVWVIVKGGYLSYLWLYVETPGSAGSTTITMQSSMDGIVWTDISSLSLDHDAGKIAYEPLERAVLANTLLRVNIDSVATGARNISVQSATGLPSLSLLPIMGVG